MRKNIVFAAFALAGLATLGFTPTRHNNSYTTNGVTYAQRGGLGSADYVVTNIDANAVGKVKSVNGKTGVVTLSASDVGALPSGTTHLSGDVPVTRTVNGKSLQYNITLNSSDVGAVARDANYNAVSNSAITAKRTVDAVNRGLLDGCTVWYTSPSLESRGFTLIYDTIFNGWQVVELDSDADPVMESNRKGDTDSTSLSFSASDWRTLGDNSFAFTATRHYVRPRVISAFSNDVGYVVAPIREEDPTVPNWAKAETPPLPPDYANVSNSASRIYYIEYDDFWYGWYFNGLSYRAGEANSLYNDFNGAYVMPDPTHSTDRWGMKKSNTFSAFAYLSDIPHIPDWATSETKPTYSASEVGAISATDTTITSAGIYTDYLTQLQSGVVSGGVRIRWSSAQDCDMTAYAYNGVAVRRDCVTDDYLWNTNSPNGVVRFKDIEGASGMDYQALTNTVNAVKELHYDEVLNVTWETRMVGGEMKLYAVTNANISVLN